VASTDFLQAVALLYAKKQRTAASDAGAKDSDLPPVRATRQSLLGLPLQAYLDNRGAVETGFKMAAKFVHRLNILRAADLPYQTQLVPLAAILAEIGPKADHAVNLAKLTRWFWCGIFGELYGSTIEGRFVKDILEVPAWLDGGPEPSTVKDGIFRADRLKSMRTRLSAAYKGSHVLLMEQGARDFRSGQKFEQAMFFTADPAIPAGTLDDYLRSHEIDPALLRADAFDAFMADPERRLLALIARATGHQSITADTAPTEGEDLPDELARDTPAAMAAG
jgi:hypothetical protein